MKPRSFYPTHGLLLAVLAILLATGVPGAEDTVTIPKARLQELERKEAELEKLLSQSQASPGRVGHADAPAATAPPTEPLRALSQLPPIPESTVIAAAELAADFANDPVGARDRYNGKKFGVRGEIAGFDEQAFRRQYRVILETGKPARRVVCEFSPPASFSAVFTADHGARLLGSSRGSHVEIARVGDVVEITGLCKGLRSSTVVIQAGELRLKGRK